MTALFAILLPLMPCQELNLQPGFRLPVSFQYRVSTANPSLCDEEDATYVRVNWFTDYGLPPHPQIHTLGPFSEVEWLTQRRWVACEVRRAIEGLAVAGEVWVYRLDVEHSEEGGKRTYKVIITYDL